MSHALWEVSYPTPNIAYIYVYILIYLLPIPPKVVFFPTGVTRFIHFMVNLGVSGLGGSMCLIQ